MVNDTTTLNGALRELGELMVDNLESMGVEDISADDGLTTLANEILNVEPSVSGLNLTTSIDLVSSKNLVDSGEGFTLSASLHAYYDDTTLTNVDLSGVLTGATIIFKDSNDDVVGQGVTGSTGIASYSIVNGISNDEYYTAYFEGTNNFNGCISNTLHMELGTFPATSISLSSSKDILSCYDGDDSAVLSCELTGDNNTTAPSGQIVYWYNEDTEELLGTSTTNNNGIASYTYESEGVGDVAIKAEFHNLSDTYYIEDCYLYDAASTDKTSQYQSSGSKSNYLFSYDTDHYVLYTGDYNTQASISPSVNFQIPLIFEVDMYAADYGTNRNFGILLSNSTGRHFPNSNNLQGNAYELFGYGGSAGLVKIVNGVWQEISRPASALSKQVWYHLSLKITDGEVEGVIKQGDTVVCDVISTNVFPSISAFYPILFGTMANGGHVWFKNIKVKKLQSLDIE